MGLRSFPPLERLALSLQHGFAFTWEGNRIRKAGRQTNLCQIAKTAGKAWKQIRDTPHSNVKGKSA